MSFNTFHIRHSSKKKYTCAITGKKYKESDGWYGSDTVYISDEGVKEIIEQYFYMHRTDQGGGTSNFLKHLERMYNTSFNQMLYGYKIPSFLRVKVLKRYNHQCYICGSKKKLEIDHIEPFNRGGLTEIENLQVLCKRHNLMKRHTKLTRHKRLKKFQLNKEE